MKRSQTDLEKYNKSISDIDRLGKLCISEGLEENDINVIDLIFEAKFITSKSEARRLIASNGFEVILILYFIGDAVPFWAVFTISYVVTTGAVVGKVKLNSVAVLILIGWYAAPSTEISLVAVFTVGNTVIFTPFTFPRIVKL